MGRIEAYLSRLYTPRSKEIDRAVKVARQVLRYEHAGITISPSDTIVLSREFLRSVHLGENAAD